MFRIFFALILAFLFAFQLPRLVALIQLCGIVPVHAFLFSYQAVNAIVYRFHYMNTLTDTSLRLREIIEIMFQYQVYLLPTDEWNPELLVTIMTVIMLLTDFLFHFLFLSLHWDFLLVVCVHRWNNTNLFNGRRSIFHFHQPEIFTCISFIPSNHIAFANCWTFAVNVLTTMWQIVSVIFHRLKNSPFLANRSVYKRTDK